MIRIRLDDERRILHRVVHTWDGIATSLARAVLLQGCRGGFRVRGTRYSMSVSGDIASCEKSETNVLMWLPLLLARPSHA
jgi:hypothetical protein